MNKYCTGKMLLTESLLVTSWIYSLSRCDAPFASHDYTLMGKLFNP